MFVDKVPIIPTPPATTRAPVEVFVDAVVEKILVVVLVNLANCDGVTLVALGM